MFDHLIATYEIPEAICLACSTSSDDFAETLAGRGAIPSPVAELMLALLGAQLGPFDDLLQHFGLLAADFHLAALYPLVSSVVVEVCSLQVLPHPPLTAQAHRFHHHGLTGARPDGTKNKKNQNNSNEMLLNDRNSHAGNTIRKSQENKRKKHGG